ncbi:MULTISPECIES: potassium-transporting ATPase subunit F [Rathayibacter]|uniref:Potassium-transporting ATPase subunit F n=1 Tax=Rathayibacter caricis DSM 15933 TaxID=1328867 RepID=A0A2T4URN3_9MICO|nr:MULTISPECIES: potassium-transporting ATPase subunit F [Rathayibacter]KQQ07454.1 potassium-transporting ATPase [Rathayibacter sp. Leaf296]KQQ18872.1 potassium-transporting ATPase [Rathayibacter sp. Leaf299]MCJ1696983.1 potassium-transporting ATPase subunit F [Rathayibacter caricis]PTL72189.1 potassium-transporting ATPase subunit F [Rathayibacter caricis DSM 15933]
MIVFDALAAVLAIGAVVFLLVALVRPERF